MSYNKDFSIIIPHRNSVQFLPKLFSSIPISEKIEIIIVDNSPTRVTKADIAVDRDYVLLYSDPKRGAGGARNVGIESAQGKWLLFLDADDYYADEAFDVFYTKLNTTAEIVYTGMGGVYLDTGEPSDRGDSYAKLVRDYLEGERSELDLRLGFASPCCKMVSHDLIKRHNIRYDEIRAGNDIYFSMVSGYYAQRVEAIDFISYIATVSRGTLTRRRDYEVIKARLYSKLHCNQFLKSIGCSNRQHSVMFALYESRRFGIIAFFEFVGMIIRFKQNPFINCSRWFKTLRINKVKEKQESKYIVK